MGVTSVRLNSDIEAPLENLARRLDRSKNYLINQAIKEFVARQAMEDSRWEDTLKALDSVKEGKLIDESEVISWLKTWGTDSESSPPTV
ncbi:MAG: ribbon-helix-helix protein, CopG family [Deltaproteobacteria bacterium]|nr:ribbon-helix-helix protein, CopG family [Deltaproteobacteria bacterium]